jgi:hypothetical protein
MLVALNAIAMGATNLARMALVPLPLDRQFSWMPKVVIIQKCQ